MQGSGNDAPHQDSTNDPVGQVEGNSVRVHCGGSIHRHDSAPRIPEGTTFQSDTIASRSKAASWQLGSLSVKSSRSVSANGNHVNTPGRAQQGNRARTTRGSSLTRVNRGSGFGSVQGVAAPLFTWMAPSLQKRQGHLFLGRTFWMLGGSLS
jgi:hypothetical protein